LARFGRGLGRTFEVAEYSLLADYYPPETRPALFAARATTFELGKPERQARCRYQPSRFFNEVMWPT